jgi:predicted alpha/beta superfamily hydrolase
MMNIKALVVVLALSLAVTAYAVETEFMQGLGDVRYHNVNSESVGRGYHIYVRLPEGYDDSNKAYPTVYLLDGGGTFPMLAPYYRVLNFDEEVPDMIIVGISYGSDTLEGGNYRSTDFTAPSDEREYWGGAADYQKFLRDELFPIIESGYRSDENRRIIFGQSIGGQFVLYTAMTQPKLFWGHIASNPALHRNLAFFLEDQADYGGPTQSKLFVASGTEDEPRFREPAVAWMNHWRDRHGAWQLRTVDLEGHSHMSAPPASFRQGLRWLFGM